MGDRKYWNGLLFLATHLGILGSVVGWAFVLSPCVLRAESISRLDAEIFVYHHDPNFPKGIQYINIAVHFNEKGVVIGEYPIPINGMEEFPFEMYFLKSERSYIIHGMCHELKDHYCKQLSIFMTKTSSEIELFRCQFEIDFLNNLYWLTGRHTCIPQDLRVEVDNDQE